MITRKKDKSVFKRTVLTAITISMALSVAGCSNSKKSSSEKLFNSDVEDLISEYTKDRPDAAITIGVYDKGSETLKLYGENGQELPFTEHRYAVGSITKTFTGCLIAKEIQEGKLDLNKRVSDYIDEDASVNSPTLLSLVTHTSGLADQWEQALAVDREKKFSRAELIKLLGEQDLGAKDYDAAYSNFGCALAGTVAADIGGGSYEEVMTSFIKNDLKLNDTTVGGEGDLANYWNWQSDDEMMAAGAIVSDVSDILAYGKMNLMEEPSYLALGHEPNATFDGNMDCGIFWIIDKENNIVWHNGEIISNDDDENPVGYQAFVGYSKEKDRVVVVLSNEIGYYEDNDFPDLIGYTMLCE